MNLQKMNLIKLKSLGFGNFSHIVEGLIRAAWIVKEKNLNVWLSSIRI